MVRTATLTSFVLMQVNESILIEHILKSNLNRHEGPVDLYISIEQIHRMQLQWEVDEF